MIRYSLHLTFDALRNFLVIVIGVGMVIGLHTVIHMQYQNREVSYADRAATCLLAQSLHQNELPPCRDAHVKVLVGRYQKFVTYLGTTADHHLTQVIECRYMQEHGGAPPECSEVLK